MLSHKILRWSQKEACPEHEHQRNLFVLEWGQGLKNWAQASRMRQLTAIEQKTLIRILLGLNRGLDSIAVENDKRYQLVQLEQLAVSYICSF